MTTNTFEVIQDLVATINSGRLSDCKPVDGDADLLRINVFGLATRPYLTDADRQSLAAVIANAYSLGIRHSTERYTLKSIEEEMARAEAAVEGGVDER